MKPVCALILAMLSSVCPQMAARAQAQRVLSGTITTGRNEAVAGATITVRSSAGELTATSDGEGNFKLAVPAEALVVKISGKNLVALERKIDAREQSEHLRFEVSYSIPPVHDSVVIADTALDPTIPIESRRPAESADLVRGETAGRGQSLHQQQRSRRHQRA
jgi:hypothetical protein